MKLVAEVVSGNPIEHEIATIERAEEISPASVGLTIAEGKALLASLQEQLSLAVVSWTLWSPNGGHVELS